MTTYFENLTTLYILIMHIKFCINRKLFTIQSINLFLYITLNYKNLKFKYLIDDIVMIFDLLKILQSWRI